MLKTKQIRHFCNVKKNIYLQEHMFFQKKGRPQGNGDKTDLRLFSKKHDFSNRARKATATKREIVIF